MFPLFTVSVHIPYRFSSLSSFIVNLKARLPFESQPLDTAGKRIDPLLLIRHFFQLIYYTVLKIAKLCALIPSYQGISLKIELVDKETQYRLHTFYRPFISYNSLF